ELPGPLLRASPVRLPRFVSVLRRLWPGWAAQAAGQQVAGGGGLVLVGKESAAPGVGEEALVALRGPAALADEELVHLGGVGGPDVVGGLAGVQAQRGGA